MTDGTFDLPSRFVSFEIGGTRAVCEADLEAELREVLARGSLYAYAAASPGARPIAGRGTAYVASLPGGERVVVRHNRHGGALAPITRDLFLAPTRAPLELATSERLQTIGVPTPVFLGFVAYPALGRFWRVDVMTRYVSPSVDLSAVLLSDDETLRAEAWEATAVLVRQMSAAGVRHHDLNAKNILLHLHSGRPPLAMVLDVDRVVFDEPPDRAREANLSRLFRSFRKWRSLYGARVEESEIEELSRRVRDDTAAPSMTRS